jgi:UPF0271 protein
MSLPPINCDLGEGESLEQTRSLMGWVDWANIACGGHAGDDASLARCLQLAQEHGVEAGAHPGIPDRAQFGRSDSVRPQVSDLVVWLEDQVGKFASTADELGVRFHHIKLHGALYHQVDRDPELGRAFLETVARRWPGVAAVVRAGGGTAALAGTYPLPIRREAFLDRAYRSDGTLVPRGEPGALLEGAEAVLQRIEEFQERGGWRSRDDFWIYLDPDTFCVHGDTPQAVALLARLRSVHPRAISDRDRGG